MVAAERDPLVHLLETDEKVYRLAERIDAQESLAGFCEIVDPSYERAAHTDLLCNELKAVDAGENDRLIVMMPPRHSKTWHTSVHFPAWSMGRNPRQQMILASYSADLAWENSGKARDLFKHPLWPFSTQLHADKQSEHRWRTSVGGVVVAAGVGGPATGFGAHKLVIDDFVKNRQDADSETIRETQWSWYTSTARTRLMPGGAIILTATHWHEDDLIGRILNGPGAARWRVIRLPAISTGVDDALNRPEGAALWPSWYDEIILRELREEIGSRDWNALYQQQPTADEGGLFKRAWFTERHNAHGAWPHLRVLAVDAAYKTGLQNDYSAIVVAGATETTLPILDVRQGRWEYPELKRWILEVAQEWQPHGILIEDTASGQSVIQELRRDTRLPVIPIKVTASKEARATAVAPTCEAKRVTLPIGAIWGDPLVNQLASFPTGQHDDMVDAFVHAVGYLMQTGEITKRQKPRDIRMGSRR